MAKEVESIAGGKNGAAKVSSMVFITTCPWKVVGALKANDIAMFYKAVFGEEKVSHITHPKRKSEQKLPLIISVELKIESSINVVFDLTGDSSSPAKSTVSDNVSCLETEDVVAAVMKAFMAGAFWEDEKFVRKKLHHFCSLRTRI
ncbi:hypothetical protein C2S51_001223 [Perilla frutescens var. frutescens]|nr:hypothetical protein C2S51_001223 [Perilla frutescens var. frutescens]